MRKYRTPNQPVTLDMIKSWCVMESPPVDRLARPVQGPCWAWSKSRSSKGYGRIGINGKMVRVHRLVLALQGKDLSGLYVDHLCRNPPCCNPEHLDMVTGRENTLRGKSPRHIANGRCADCGSTDGKICRKTDNSRWWKCRICTAMRKRVKESTPEARDKALMRNRAKRATPRGTAENRARARAHYYEGTSLNWRAYLTDKEKDTL